MPAAVIKWGDSPPTAGGDFEREVIRTLREKLPDQLTLVTNPALATRSGYLYEFDIILFAPGLCDVLECKAIKPRIGVLEDCLRGHGTFSVDRAFSLVDTKARIVAGRLGELPFSITSVPRVFGRIVVPTDTTINFVHRDHESGSRVLTLADAARLYRNYSKEHIEEWDKRTVQQLRDAWTRYRDERIAPGCRTEHTLGRFMLKRVLSERGGIREYLATDEPPCKVDVYLKETPYDPVMNDKQLAEYLNQISREMQTLRLIRHPYVQCVIGHFQTGTSLVEVSDWFEGKPIEEEWRALESLSLPQKIGLFIKFSDALAFCHRLGVFHRNLHAGNVQLSENCDDLRVRGFDLARNLQLTRSVSEAALIQRDRRILPPEELRDAGAAHNPRLADIYQAGVLFYRVAENGAWPFEEGIEFVTGQEQMREMRHHDDEDGVDELRNLIRSMLDMEPIRRPDLMNKVESALSRIASGS